jgi:30S ribosomal protein S31
MGRGDKRTRKGKIFAGSFGNARPANEAKKPVGAATTEPKEKKVVKEKSTEKKAAPKKAAAKKKED